MIKLFESGDHKNIFFNDLTTGGMVQANQHIIIHGDEAMVLDPGGHKVHTALFAGLSSIIPINKVRYLFFSHQDPDIIAAANAWLMLTDAEAYLSSLWTRFITHFGIDELVSSRIHPIPDQGMVVSLGGSPLYFLPAHFLHSPGNFQVYDPVSKILYSGDLGASLGIAYSEVTDFEAHLPAMEGFHRRYIPSNKAMAKWARMVKTLDIQQIAPQHGAIFPTPEMARKFIAWAETFPCALDSEDLVYQVPS